MYTIEELIKTFDKHAIQAEETNKQMLESFKENNPNEPIPKHFLVDFSLAKALAAICREISILKDDQE
jgi:hypothetical protein